MDSETCQGDKLFAEIIALLWSSDNIEIVIIAGAFREKLPIITIVYGAFNGW